MGKLLVNLSTGPDNLAKASVALVVANAGLAGGQETAMFLSVEAVKLVKQGATDGLQSEGFKSVKELVETFLANGGMIWVCPPCAGVHDVTEANMLAGPVFAGGAKLVEFLSQGAGSVSY
jgi:predicted peroxiredoxin